jgi:Raf kinase inhibitor-like YbhB/YbcL family protein
VRSYALTMTDPDVPDELGLPRAFAHWLVADIPADVVGLAENASGTPGLPRGAREFASDFVTFRIPGYGRGYGAPWPPDATHRYVFTLYALKAERIELGDAADYPEFVRAVLPLMITTATLIGLYGPAKAPLPSAA